MLGLTIQRFLPERHLGPESKDAVKLVAGLIATMAALVLGILVGSAKGSFDAVNNSITQGGANYIYLDRLLADYGPETKPIRLELRDGVTRIIARLWPDELVPSDPLRGQPISISGDMEKILGQLRGLPVKTPEQMVMRNEKLRVAYELMQYRWLVIEEAHSSMSPLFLGVLLFWLTALNLIYGLYAPRNGTVIAVLFVCAISVAGALFLIEEMGQPLTGYIKVPSTPFQRALNYMGQ